jgi:GR25 family glycosyltransferase involved in LPS biosynthesis
MKAFVIGLLEKQDSYDSAMKVVQELQEFGHEAEFFPGVFGDNAIRTKEKEKRQLFPFSIKAFDVDEDYLKEFIIPEKYNEFIENHYFKILQKERLKEKDFDKFNMPGVVGCFMSHYLLWRKCIELDEPIMIFEDDVKFYRNFVEIDWQDILILVLGKTSYENEPYKTHLENPVGNPQPKKYPNSSMPGTVGYAIKPSAAKRLVKFYRTYHTSADNAINQSIVTIEYHNYLMGRHRLEEEGNFSYVKSKDWK